MENENKNAYSEVVEILKTIDDEKRLEALPMEMLELIKSKANPEYKPEISTDIPLDEQNLQPETLKLLSWIAYKYWNDEINIDEPAEECKIEDNIENKEENKEAELPVLYKEYRWYEKIKNKIVEFFRIIFNRNREEEGIN